MKILTENEILKWCENNKPWIYDGKEIVLKIEFSNFSEAIAHIMRVALLMEKHEHHATIENTYNRIKYSMATHDAGNKITDKDTMLAEEINKIC